MVPVEKYIRWIYLDNHIIWEVLNNSNFVQTWNLRKCEGSAECFILSWTSKTSFKLRLLALRIGWCNYRTRVRSLVMLVTNWLTHWLTHCRFVNLIDMTLACDDANSKLIEVVTVADVDDEDHVGNSLLQIWKLRFGHKAKLLFRLWAQALVKILMLAADVC